MDKYCACNERADFKMSCEGAVSKFVCKRCANYWQAKEKNEMGLRVTLTPIHLFVN